MINYPSIPKGVKVTPIHNTTILCADHLRRFSIENVFKRLDYLAVERWLAILKAEKYGLVEKPLPGTIFECVAIRHPVTIVLGE